MLIKHILNRRTWVYSVLTTLLIAVNAPETHAQDNSLTAATSTCFSVGGCQNKPITSREVKPRNVHSTEYICSKQNTRAASTFKVCNEEDETIMVVGFAAGNIGMEYAKLLAPKLPIELDPGSCRNFVIKAGENNPYECGDGRFGIILNIESKSENGLIRGVIPIGL